MDRPFPDTVPRLLDSLRSSTRPALLWYGADGERVELSGRVLDNWAAKTANLWVDELDLAADDVVGVGEDLHWRVVAVVLGTWAMGAAVRPVPSGGSATAGDRAVIGLADTAGAVPPLLTGIPAGARAVVVDRPALSLGYRGELPDPDALDYCAEIRAHGDVYAGLEEPDPQGPGLLGPDGALTHGQLLPRAAQRAAAREAAWDGAAAVHVPGGRLDAPWLLDALAVLAGGRAVVLTDRDASDPAWRSVLATENAVAF